ncbi:NAD(P)/FAD-dependent oxidoreductase [Streptomyces sp. GESEQ-13]|uniref:NAD(P)/FAD-dependent oxidoreductase n=1 Tax=Streptomyces sp. GESEQ-13 TaxID=2812654 RepID=UPI001B33153F
MPHPGILIVGASQAGAQVATSLRERGSTAPVTLVGAEPHLPYQRPPLSKAFLADKATEDSLLLRSAEYYRSHDIDVVTDEWVADVVLDRDGSGTAVTRSGRTFDFGRLALTTGGTPRRLSIPGADLDGVLYLRDLDDAVRLRGALKAARNVVVVGGGFIGLEAAAVARASGKEVVVVEALDRLLARAVAPVMSDFCLAAHRRRGSRILLERGVIGFEGNGTSVTSVALSDGTSVPADLVLVGIGLVPRTEIAERIGLRCETGIVIDAYGRTSNPDVVAAGDCTDLDAGDGRLVRIESVANAIAQARAAAATLAGSPTPLAAVPWFWSDQADVKLQIAGLSAGHDSVVVRGEPASESFSVLYFREGEVVAVNAVNAPRDYMLVKRILDTGGSLPMDRAGDVDTPLKDLVVRVA